MFDSLLEKAWGYSSQNKHNNQNKLSGLNSKIYKLKKAGMYNDWNVVSITTMLVQIVKYIRQIAEEDLFHAIFRPENCIQHLVCTLLYKTFFSHLCGLSDKACFIKSVVSNQFSLCILLPHILEHYSLLSKIFNSKISFESLEKKKNIPTVWDQWSPTHILRMGNCSLVKNHSTLDHKQYKSYKILHLQKYSHTNLELNKEKWVSLIGC